MARIVFMVCMALMIPGPLLAESSYFLGTRTGWGLTQQAFLDGRYKEHNLFIVIGAGPTTNALHTISGWKSKTTFVQDVTGGADFFGDQLSGSVTSVPDNCSALGKSVSDLFSDPVKEFRDFSLITPVAVVGKTAMNAVRIGWHGAMVVAEPVVRTGAGLLALVGSPFIKPATYTGVFLAYTGTAVYGYGSSAAAGAVMMGATGTVLALDVATTPAVAVYEAHQPEPPIEPAPQHVAE
jgi:hypothetical protein